MGSPHDIGNPGYGGSNVHPWDVVPSEPGRFDFMVENVPGVDPMAFNREFDYQMMQQGVRHMQVEQDRIARMGPNRYATAPVAYGTGAQTAVLPAKKKVEPPKPPPVLKHKYVVIDERPSKPQGRIIPPVGPLVCRVVATIFVYGIFGMAFSTAQPEMIALPAVIMAIGCYAITVQQAYKRTDTKSLQISWPIHFGAMAMMVVGAVVTGLSTNISHILSFLGLGIVTALIHGLFAEPADVVDEIIEELAIKRDRHTFAAGKRCNLCGQSDAPAVAMRRYFFNSENTRRNYTHVCEKHRHYIREVYSDGSEKWPQIGDCTEPGLLKQTIKK